MESRTTKALAEITDEGLFERIATSVLRLRTDYEGLSHPGITAGGKTRKSPVDGVTYIGNHVLIAHHTTTAQNKLRDKWLLDPTKIVRRPKTRSPLPEPGDFHKTLKLVRSERQSNPNLLATLILTTNTEPDHDLLRQIMGHGRDHEISIDVWSLSRIAAVLDTNPTGQFIRSKLLGIDEELLSIELLDELSDASLRAFSAGDIADTRVSRQLDDQLSDSREQITFLVGESGTGKTVACHKHLEAHRASGGLSFVVSHSAVEQSHTFDQALTATLRAFKPSLSDDRAPSTLFSPDKPAIVLVEDVNLSREPQRLIEKISGWNEGQRVGAWKILCPVWPHVFAGVRSQLKKQTIAQEMRAAPMSTQECSSAILLRAIQSGVHLNKHQAEVIARALGNDPLLIALNQDWTSPTADAAITSYVEAALASVQANAGLLSAVAYQALIELGEAMLAHRQFDIDWPAITAWKLSSQSIDALSKIALSNDILRVEPLAAGSKVKFRHDRVREWILVKAAVNLHRNASLSDELIADPSLAEVIAGLIVNVGPDASFIKRICSLNPLSVFHAVRIGIKDDTLAERLFSVAGDWLKIAGNRGRATQELRWQCLTSLTNVASPQVLELISLFPSKWIPGQIARLHNGDAGGGIELCMTVEIHTATAWLGAAVENALATHPDKLIADVVTAIERCHFQDPKYCGGLLTFAGVLGSPKLGNSLFSMWERDTNRGARLDSYLWALMRCATEDQAAPMLEGVCHEWALLPESNDGSKPSPKDDLASHSVRWAVERAIPVAALDYLIERAAKPDLSWQIEYLFHGTDHPKAVVFQVRKSAERRRRSLDHYSVNNRARDHWRFTKDRQQSAMSVESKIALCSIWQNCQEEENLRIAAFDLWAVNSSRSDEAILNVYKEDVTLSDRIFKRRLELGCSDTIPELIAAIERGDTHYWHYARYVWSPELYEALDRSLARLSTERDQNKIENAGYTITGVLLRLSPSDAEPLLQRYWDSLGTTPNFVKAALYFGTPSLLSAADSVIKSHPEPPSLLNHLCMTYGVRTEGEVGINREHQVLVLKPYLSLISNSDLRSLSEACNDNGWYKLRMDLFDPLLGETSLGERERLEKGLKEYSKKYQAGPIEWDIERLTKRGVSWEVVAGYLEEWLKTESRQQALDVVARGIRTFGQRRDIDRLRAWPGEDSSYLEDVIADTRFAVFRRVS
ncbi:hypothetical protein JP75_20450 [Devosia riboflavina]|uniref:Uncharacterized protein n=1 Tax=Devosia riboflavina TaxID=46914 RepID=A0A087LY40_9HYPH|nr:hypothetical protein [Devosia riboflavina]KFL29543.1 hypothetical protein JP75_20450 [Devosia riboflavina]